MPLQPYELKQKQALPLEAKIIMSRKRIRDWYEHWQGMVYASVSGGLDSAVMYHLIHTQYPDVPGIFVNTTMEFPEIVRFVHTLPNVTCLTTEKTPAQVFREYGYPVVSKEVSRSIYYARRGSRWALNRFDGQRPDGSPSPWYARRYMKWKHLLYVDFAISDMCCHEMKLQPLAKIEKERKPFIGSLAEESARRRMAYLSTGCNAYASRKPRSMPLGFWTHQDILHYIRDTGIPYAREIYGEIIEDRQGVLRTTMEQRTGCFACPLGQKARRKGGGESRFERLKRLHPKQYDYAMRPLEAGGLGLAPILDFLGVPH